MVASSFKQVKKGFLSMWRLWAEKYHVFYNYYIIIVKLASEESPFVVVDLFISLNFMRKEFCKTLGVGAPDASLRVSINDDHKYIGIL